MPDLTIPIDQLIRNYTLNLPAMPPRDTQALVVHRFFLGFYQAFQDAALACGIPETGQPNVLERAQKTLWTFARSGRLAQDADGAPCLEAGRQALQENLKFPKVEETLRLLEELGAPVRLRCGGAWQAAGKLKDCEGGRLSFPGDPGLAAALLALVERILAGRPKDKQAYERFLRADPRAVLAREQPPLDLPADAPVILANLPPAAAQAWQELVDFLRSFPAYRPAVEFRSIHHGMWVANYDALRGGKDLCGLIVQNGEMTVRTILFGESHFDVKATLAGYGEPVTGAFHNARYYEEFEHQWLFIPCRGVEDTGPIKKLLTFQVEAFKKK